MSDIRRGELKCANPEQIAHLEKQIDEQRTVALERQRVATEKFKKQEQDRIEMLKRELVQKLKDAAAAAEVEAKRKADLNFDKHLRAILNDRKQSPEARAIAAIALGKAPSNLKRLPLTAEETSVVDRNVVKLALSKVDANRKNTVASSIDDQLRAIVNDPKQPLVSRNLAAAVLGIDLNKTASKAPSVASSPAPSVSATESCGICTINYYACLLQHSPSSCQSFLSPKSASGSPEKVGNADTAQMLRAGLWAQSKRHQSPRLQHLT